MNKIILTNIFVFSCAMLLTAQTKNDHNSSTNKNNNTYSTNYKQHQLQQLKSSGITLTNEQADSVAAINLEIWRLTKKNPTQNFEDYRVERLTSALQNYSLAIRVENFFKQLQYQQDKKMKEDSASFKKNK
jgi:hypothetical protein